jgi:hypothetical protein
VRSARNYDCRVERPRDPYEFVPGLWEDVAELRASSVHLSPDMGEVKHDLRRLDDRVFQVLLIQLATLATALGSLIAALVSVTTR